VNGEVKQVILDKAGDLYLDVEIVDNTVADNQQDAPFTFDNEDAKRATVLDLINKPYVLTEDLYHPDWTKLDPENKLSDSEWLKKYFQWQEDFAIGRVRKVFEAGKGIWRSWLHITNPIAKEAYLKGKIPKAVSIGFFSPDYKVVNGVKRIMRGIALHVAAVVKPAWKNAFVRSECIGTDSCMRQINQAGIPSCPFCIATVLNSLKPDQCYSDSINSKPIFQGSSMKLDLAELKSLSEEEKKKLLKALSGEPEPEEPENVKPEEEEGETAKLRAKAATVKGAPIQPPTATPPVASTDTQTEATDDKMTIAKLQKQVADLLKKDAQRDEKSQVEDNERKMGVIESFTANESDEALKKTVIEKAMALPSIEDVKFWLSLKYAQAIEMTTPTRRGKVGHAGIHEYIDTRAVTRTKQNPIAEFSSSVFAFGED
jgi:hypothetical protein